MPAKKQAGLKMSPAKHYIYAYSWNRSVLADVLFYLHNNLDLLIFIKSLQHGVHHEDHNDHEGEAKNE
jgi:hypothetical protein